MSRGYGKYRRGSSHHSSFHFDSLFKENANKPSAARSAATVGKWGITSFTSIRTLNGRLEHESPATPAAEAAPKPKKFFKSRNSTDSQEVSSVYNSPPRYTNPHPPSKKQKIAAYESTSPRKFFSSKSSSSEKTVLSSNVNNKNEPHKPPIVLRICRGKSQLLNDSDESESTPTPTTSSNATSPRALRETSRPSNCRITRSARKSMQQDPSSSPATADTASDFPLFTSPRKESDVDLSPQYVPAEKFELERKALYDNLLKPNSPKEDPNSPCESETNKSDIEERQLYIQEDVEEKDSDERLEEEEKDSADRLGEEKDNDDRLEEEEKDNDNRLEENDYKHQKEEEQEEEITTVVSVSVRKPPDLEYEEPEIQYKKPSIEEDWSSDTDSNSNSTAAELEVKQIHPAPEEITSMSNHNENDMEAPSEPPPVKLVISKKKGSIFKSRALVNDDSNKKRRALYKHKWQDDKEGKTSENQTTTSATRGGEDDEDEFGFKDEKLTRVTIKSTEEEDVTSVKCSKNDKGYYMVVRNVKKAHQIQEIGEFQEFNDDVEYILDALEDKNPVSTRCLSAITLASKCMVPAFRMHVRAHGTVAKFFKALHDSTKDPSLGLCTATVMFVLSQDRLNMDLDRDCLELMLNLLESDVSYQQALDVCGLSSAQLEKNKQKVRELCAEIQSQGHAMHLNLESITTGQLAMETLLSLTSKRAGEWFKEELRELGGLEHIMKTIHECCRQVSDYVVSWTDPLMDKLKKVDRCLRVLENVTHNNEENQTYILKYDNGMILDTLVNLYKLCDREIPLYPVTDIKDKTSTGAVIREALLVTLKVLINLTHHFNKRSFGSQLIGSRCGIIDTSLHLLLQVPHYIPEQKKFELGVLVLMLLINLIQDQEGNKKLLMDAKAPSKLESIYSREESAVEALIAQFYEWESCAKIAENKTNAILDGEKDVEDAPTNPQYKSNEEFIEETVRKLLQKAGTHMEYTFLASYIVMLVGFLIMDDPHSQCNIRQFLRGNNFIDMVELLRKFFNFMNLTASTEASSVCAVKTTEKVIKFLEECDKKQEENDISVNSTQGFPSECVDLSFRLSSE